jgi:hypothetical protein
MKETEDLIRDGQQESAGTSQISPVQTTTVPSTLSPLVTLPSENTTTTTTSTPAPPPPPPPTTTTTTTTSTTTSKVVSTVPTVSTESGPIPLEPMLDPLEEEEKKQRLLKEQARELEEERMEMESFKLDPDPITDRTFRVKKASALLARSKAGWSKKINVLLLLISLFLAF